MKKSTIIKIKDNIRKTLTIPVKRKIFLWKVLDTIENICSFTYKIIMPFVPALVVNMLEGSNGFLVFILTLAGVFRLTYNIFGRSSIKDIYLKLKWMVEKK